MIALIQTDADRVRLRAIAESWLGTPYVGDGAVKGAGSSCHAFLGEILREFGHETPSIPSRGKLLKAEIAPAMLSFFSANPAHFQRVDDIQVGDVILTEFPLGHLGIFLGDSQVIHSWQHQGVHLSHFTAHLAAHRLNSIWRPIKAASLSVFKSHADIERITQIKSGYLITHEYK